MKRFLGRVASGHSPIFAVLLTVATQGLIVLLNVATGVITARLLGPDGRGIFAAATIWPQFLAGLAALGVPTAIVFTLRSNPASTREIAGAAYLLTAAAGLVATAGGLIIAPQIMSDAAPGTILLAQFCILWTCTSMVTVALRQVAVASGAFQVFATSSYLSPLLFLIALLLAWPTVGITPTSATVCLMLSSPLGMLWTLVALRRSVRSSLRGSRAWMGPILRYAGRVAPSDIAGGIAGFIDRLVLIPFLPAAELGLYVVAYSLSRLMFVLQTAVSSVLYPSMAGRTKPEIKILHDLAFRLILYAGGAGAIVVSLLAAPALSLVYGPDYAGAAILLQILIVEAALSCLGQVTIQLYLSLERPGFTSMVQTSGLAVVLVLLLLLVPQHGATGAATALALTAAFRLVVLLGGLRRLLDLPLPGLLATAQDIRFIRSKLS